MKSKRFVLDCSVTMAWCFEDEANLDADNVHEILVKGEAVVPALWPLEVANVLLVAKRRKRIDDAGVHRFWELLQSLPITVEPFSAWGTRGLSILEIANKHNLSSYDATYCELALREGLPLATLDAKLKKALSEIGIDSFID